MQRRSLVHRGSAWVLGLVVSVIIGGISSGAPVTGSLPRALALGCANAVVCENQLSGTDPSVWDLTNGASDATIQGFTTDISANKGDIVHFKVNTGANAYRLDIYRMGYYGGLGARKITTILPSAKLPQKQPACVNDASVGLIDCGNWAESATWTVPTSAVSGIYFAKLVRSDTGGASHVFFVVRDDASTSDLLFQTSDATWLAYNDFGGNSFYVANNAINRAYKVSYNRPFGDRDSTYAGPSQSWVMNAEYPMVRWLEANGYNVTYTSSVDTDRRGNLLLNHRAFLSVGHDEYWSAAQRSNVEAARSAGINLAFFSGNEVFWKTRWENSIDGSNTAYRTLVSYKETHANSRIDPKDPPTWTGTWRDPRFSISPTQDGLPPADGGRPENNLTGTLFMVNGVEFDSLTVPAAYGKLRFWRNTSVAALGAGQTATLTAGCGCVLGYEWDTEPDNGSRPGGLIDLSSSTWNVANLLQDYGSTYAPGTATHKLALYRAPSGALVFGAGTVQWSWGLDGTHDNGISTPEPAMQQATINLLADMGAQPATLQPGMVAATASTDHTPPTSTITSPTSGATVTSGSPVSITGTAADVGGVLAGVEVSVDAGATWHAATGTANWSYSWTPTVLGSITIKSRAIDDSANIETASAGVTINVQSRPCPCSLWSNTATPASANSGDLSAVEVGVKFTSDLSGYVTGIRFYKGSSNTGTHVGSLWSSTGTLLAQATFAGETASGWQQVSFATPVAVTANTTYVASYHTNVGNYSVSQNYFLNSGTDNVPLHAPSTGAAGGNGLYTYSAASAFPTNSYNGSNYWVDPVFATTLVNPVISNVQATNVTGTGATITWTTDKASDSQVDYGTTLAYGTSSALNSSLVTTHSVTLSGLSSGTTYHYRAKSKDSSGNLGTSGDFTFSTPRACPCSIWPSTATPAVASQSDYSAVEVGVKFTADVAGHITGIRFFKGAGNTSTHVGSLWSSTGTLLAQATFTGETASGWQQVNFAAPVAVTANTTYVASYHTNVGNYSVDSGYFNAAGVDNAPLHALATGVAGGNGVYTYSASSAFPTSSYNGSNYWVDVVFSTP